MYGHEFVVPVQNVRTRTDLPTKSQNLYGQNSKIRKNKIKNKISTSVEAKKQVLRDVYRL